jgi:hypothetical protein
MSYRSSWISQNAKATPHSSIKVWSIDRGFIVSIMPVIMRTMRTQIIAKVSWVEIKPASKGRNDPASGARIRPPEREAFFFQTSLISTSYAGLFGRKMPTYADFRGWVISTIAGWFPVTADTKETKSNLRTWYTFAGPLGQVVYNRQYIFAWKDGCLIGTYNTFEEATESFTSAEQRNTQEM